MRGIRTRVAAIALAAALPATIAACGGGSSSTASNESPQQVLKETFSNPKSITSGKLDINVSASAQGSQSGSFTANISGPFQGSSQKGVLPQLDLTAKVSGQASGTPGINFEGGLVATKSNAYVEYQGQAYQVPTQAFDQFKTAYAQQAQSQGSSGSNASSVFKRFGIDPATWLTNEKNEGTADVAGTSTIHISGDADVAKIVGDLAKVAESVPGAQAQGISPSQLGQVKNFVKTAHIDVYSGESDHLLRKLDATLAFTPPSSAQTSGVSSVNLDFSLTLSDVNQPQTISAPQGAKPISQLAQQLGGLGLLGGLSGATGSTGSAPTSSGSASAQLQQYRKCVNQAGGNTAAINQCLQKLSGG